MSETHLVLFANEAFYTAFAARDIAAMSAVWSERATITCIHPGSPPLVGKKQVMQSWRMILANPQSPAIVCRTPTAEICGDVAYVLCWEQIELTFLIATNIFVHEGNRWRLVHHQAGVAPPPQDMPDAPEVVVQ